MILIIAYLVLGYWAAGKVIYANKVVIYTGYAFIIRKVMWGFFLGWTLIPIALLKLIFGRK